MLASKTFNFCASHNLPNYDGLCKNLHGHNYKLIVTVKGDKKNVETNGFVIDFTKIKHEVNPIIRLFDHQHLNDVASIIDSTLSNPTAENIIIILWRLIQKRLKNLYKLTLYETDTCWIEYWGEFEHESQ